MSQRSTTRDARPAASCSFSPESTRSLVKKRKDACAHDALGGIGGAQSAGMTTKTQLLPQKNPHLEGQPLPVWALQTRQQDSGSAGGAVDLHSRRVLPRQGRATPTHPSGELGSPTRLSQEHIRSVTSGAVAQCGVIARIDVTTRMRVPVHAPHPGAYRRGSWRRATRTVPAHEGPTCQIARLRRRSGAHQPGDGSDAARSTSLALADTRGAAKRHRLYGNIEPSQMSRGGAFRETTTATPTTCS